MTLPLDQSPIRVDSRSFADAISSGQIWPGDAILFRYSAPNWTQRTIAKVQARALADLPVRSTGFSPPPSDSACQFTHAGMVFDRDHCVEMTSPRCRLVDWPARLRGVAEIAVVRPALATRHQLGEAAKEAYCAIGTRYPRREILLYWLWSWSWGKLHGKTPFSRVFRSRQRNVCSGSLIQWWRAAQVDLGLSGLDTWPEAWYPARLLADSRFELVFASHELHETHEENRNPQPEGGQAPAQTPGSLVSSSCLRGDPPVPAGGSLLYLRIPPPSSPARRQGLSLPNSRLFASIRGSHPQPQGV